MKPTLDAAVSSQDSARLAEKARYLGSVKIEGPESIMPIPEGAQVMRLKGGGARFFSEPLPNNGCIGIPEGATRVQFPQYHRNAYHIQYWEPRFDY